MAWTHRKHPKKTRLTNPSRTIENYLERSHTSKTDASKVNALQGGQGEASDESKGKTGRDRTGMVIADFPVFLLHFVDQPTPLNKFS